MSTRLTRLDSMRSRILLTVGLLLCSCVSDPSDFGTTPLDEDPTLETRTAGDTDNTEPDQPDMDASAASDSSEGDEVWDCSSGPHCVGPRTLEYCVDGVMQQVPCPDGYGCASSGSCEPIVCEASDTACVDEITLQLCADNGTRFDLVPCDPFRCEVDACVGDCVEGTLRCLDDRYYQICSAGVFVDGSCPEDDLGTSCVDDSCLTLCERAALESDYTGCVFWAVDLDNIADPSGAGPGAYGIALVVSNISDYAARIAIESAPGAFVASAVLEPGALETFELSPRSQIGTRIETAAYRITSTVPVVAYQFNPLNREGTSSTDASLLLPESALGDRYRVMSYPAQGTNQRGFVAMVGVGEEPTTVSLTVHGQTIAGVDYRDAYRNLQDHVLEALDPGMAAARSLEPFDVWQVETSHDSDLTGSLVRSDGPVAVFAGTRCSNVPEGVPNCDHLEHQMLSVASWDRSYVATPGPLRDTEATTFRVLADFDRTFVETEPPIAGTPTTMGPGDVLTFDLMEPTSIRTSEPVMVGQYLASSGAGADGIGDPSFTIIPPVEQFRDAYVFLVPDSYETDTITLIRTASLGGSAGIMLDDVDIEGAFGEIFSRVGDSGYEFAQIVVDDGVHELTGSSPFGVLVTGYDRDVSYAYPGGLQLNKPWASSLDDAAGQCSDGGWLGAVCDTGVSGRCARGTNMCGPESICTGLRDAVDERCNGIDDDCDGAVDNEGVCAGGLDFYFVSPGSGLIELTEGDSQEFRVAIDGSGDEPVEIAWYIDSAEAPVAYGESMTWRVLAFEAGVHRVWVVAGEGDAHVELEWLVHVHDVPTNYPTLYGQVTDLGGEIFPQVPITVVAPGTIIEPVPGNPSVTDFRGFYALSLAPGMYQLMIDAEEPVLDRLPRGRRVLDMTVLSEVDTRQDVVAPVARMWGTVYAPDADGTLLPVPNTNIWTYGAYSTTCGDCHQSAVTSTDGQYEILLHTGLHDVHVYSPGYPQRLTQVVISGDTRRDFTLDSPLPAGETVEFVATVIDRCSDEPVSGVQLNLTCGGYHTYPTSDEEGKITARVPPGTCEAFTYQHIGAEPPVGCGRVSLGTIVAPSETEIALEIPNAYVSGTVRVEGETTGLADVVLAFRSDDVWCTTQTRSSAESSSQGTYGLNVLDSTYRVEVTPEFDSGWANFTIPPDANTYSFSSCAEELDIVLSEPVHRVDGTITAIRRNAEGELVSEPVENLKLYLQGPSRAEAVTDAEGGFEFLTVPGEYEIDIRYDSLGYPSSFWGVLPAVNLTIWYSNGELTSTAPDSPVHLELDPLELPLTLVSGTVTNIEGGGLGLEGAELHWTHQGVLCERCEGTGVTDDAGYYEVLVYRGIPGADGELAGSYHVDLDPGEFFPPQTFDDLTVEGRETTWDFAVDE